MNDYTLEQTQPSAGNGNALNSAAHSASASIESAVKRPAPNATFRSAMLACAGASLCASLALKTAGNRDDAVFVGQWVPTFLLIALWMAVVREDVAPQV